jgi:hypothetical protein
MAFDLRSTRFSQGPGGHRKKNKKWPGVPGAAAAEKCNFYTFFGIFYYGPEFPNSLKSLKKISERSANSKREFYLGQIDG